MANNLINKEEEVYNNKKIKVEGVYMRFPIRLYKDENGDIFGECPIIKGCVEQGATISETIDNVTACIRDCLQMYKDDNTKDYLIDYNSDYNVDTSEYTPIGIWEVII